MPVDSECACQFLFWPLVTVFAFAWRGLDVFVWNPSGRTIDGSVDYWGRVLLVGI